MCAIDFPSTGARASMSCISLSNCCGYNACGPSLSAFSGWQWTSTIIPSAPPATEASPIGGILSRIPTAWLGSTIIGRWVSPRSTGIALKSRVLRVAFSKVRIPRSHRMTFSVPLASRYSAAIKKSSIVAESPRLRMTGFPSIPTFFRSSKFCILRAPI